MNSKSSTRLRLECLETRSVLSAIGFPLVALPSPAAAAGEFYRIGAHQVAPMVIPDAVQNVVAMPSEIRMLTPDRLSSQFHDSSGAAALSIADPMFTPDRLSPELGDSLGAAALSIADPMLTPDRLSSQFHDSSGAAALSIADPMLTPDRLSPELHDRSDAVVSTGVIPILLLDQVSAGLGISSSQQPAVGGQSGDPAPTYDYQRVGDPTDKPSLLSDATLDASKGLADSGGVVPIQDQPDMSVVIAMNSAQLQIEVAITAGGIAPDAATPSLETPRRDGLPSYDPAVSTPWAIHVPLQPRFPGDVAPDVPVGDVYPAALSPMIETLTVSHGPAGFRAPSSQVVESSVESDVSTAVDPSLPLVKGHAPDLPATSDASRAGDQALAAVDATPPSPNGIATPLATTAASVDAASNSVFGGFIALDDTSTTTSRLANAISPDSSLGEVKPAEPGQDSWLADILPNPRKPVESASRNSNAVRSSEYLAAEFSARPEPVSPPVADAEEGGSIELAIAAPSLGTAGEDALPAEESNVDNAAQQLSEIRPQSGVGLFCDIEVAIAPTLPIDGSSSAAISDRNADAPLAHAGIPASKADAATKRPPPPSKLSHVTMAGLTEQLPMFFGAAILVSLGGLRLQENVSQRDRRLCSIDDLRQTPKRVKSAT